MYLMSFTTDLSSKVNWNCNLHIYLICQYPYAVIAKKASKKARTNSFLSRCRDLLVHNLFFVCLTVYFHHPLARFGLERVAERRQHKCSVDCSWTKTYKSFGWHEYIACACEQLSHVWVNDNAHCTYKPALTCSMNQSNENAKHFIGIVSEKQTLLLSEKQKKNTE